MPSTAEYRPVDASQSDANQQLKGIGGWLVLMALWQIAGPIRSIVNLFIYYTSSDVRLAFEKIPTAANLELTLNAICAAIVFFTSYTFFAQKRLFPIMYTVEMASVLLFLPIDYSILVATTTLSFSSVVNPDDIGKVIRASVWGLVMLAYVWQSKRVKNTFIN